MPTVMNNPDGATPLDPDELAGLKLKHISTRGELDQVEQANIQEGLKWLNRQNTLDILTEQFLKKSHQKLFGDVWAWAGSFRQTEKNIGIDPIMIPIDLRNLLDDVKYWIKHDTYPAIEIGARYHHRLVQIHLFPNGNGRHSRIIADAVLTKLLNTAAIDWAGGFRLEEMNDRRKNYILALRSADAGDYAPIIEFVS